MLTREQKSEFKRNGFLVLNDVLSDEIVDEMQRVYENDPLPNTVSELEALVDDPSSASFDHEDRLWKVMYDRSLIISPPQRTPFEEVNDQVRRVAEELTGEGLQTSLRTTQFVHRLSGDGELVGSSAKQPSDLTDQPHIDGLGDTDGRGVYPIGAVVYADRVQPRGGGFSVWPGSHWQVADFLRDHDRTDALDGVPAPTETGWDYDTRIRDRFDPFEISGDAGTVVLWHGLLIHSGGVNLTPGQPRKELVSRFYFPEEERAEDRLTDPFAGWPIEELSPDLSRFSN